MVSHFFGGAMNFVPQGAKILVLNLTPPPTIIPKVNLNRSKFSVFLSSHSLARPRGSWIPSMVALTKCFRFRIDLLDNPSSKISEHYLCNIYAFPETFFWLTLLWPQALNNTHFDLLAPHATLPHNAAFPGSALMFRHESVEIRTA